jgi:A/G-specific adenine glycosylase
MTKVERSPWPGPLLRTWLLQWYERNKRDLPWRRTSDPYAIWVSEIMLQQTRVAAVIERFEAFIARFPTVTALAAAPEQDVLAMWSGLGYYRRARMLHQGAHYVVERLGGTVPRSALELRELPGVGGYTAAAVASIAFGEAIAVVDGNVERVLCRIAGWSSDGTAARRRAIEKAAAQLLDPQRPGDFNQAMMELGATVCLPRNPLCLTCPLAESCRTRGEHKKTSRPSMTTRDTAVALCLRKRKGTKEVLLEQRPESTTVMPGMWELPTMRERHSEAKEATMFVRHAIMQVNYLVRVCEPADAEIAEHTLAGGARRWVPLEHVGDMALTGLARKVLTRARLLAPIKRGVSVTGRTIGG